MASENLEAAIAHLDRASEMTDEEPPAPVERIVAVTLDALNATIAAVQQLERKQ